MQTAEENVEARGVANTTMIGKAEADYLEAYTRTTSNSRTPVLAAVSPWVPVFSVDAMLAFRAAKWNSKGPVKVDISERISTIPVRKAVCSCLLTVVS